MERDEILSRIRGFSGLQPPREVMLRLQEIAASPEAKISEVGALIERDMALTMRLLRVANSSYFGFPRRVECIQEAVMVIGLRHVCDLVACIATAPVYVGAQGLVDCGALWLHSCCVAEATRVLSRHCAGPGAPAYVGGLLHDVGIVALAAALPGEYRRALEHRRQQGLTLEEAERDVLGVDHGWAGGMLLEHWALPAALVEMARDHHEGTASRSRGAMLVEVADVLAVRAKLPEPVGEAPEPEVSSAARSALQLTEADLARLTIDLESRRDALATLHRETWSARSAA